MSTRPRIIEEPTPVAAPLCSHLSRHKWPALSRQSPQYTGHLPVLVAGDATSARSGISGKGSGARSAMPLECRSTSCQVTSAPLNDRTGSKKSGKGSDHMPVDAKPDRDEDDQAVLRAMSCEEWLTVGMIAMGCGKSYYATYYCLKRLLEKGRVEYQYDNVLGRAYWKLPAGEQFHRASDEVK